MRRVAVTGSLLIASAVLSIGGYLVLGTQFGWPAVLDEPGTTALDAFVAAQAWVRLGFYLFLLSSLVLVPAAVGLHDHLDRGSPGSVSVAAFGVLGAFAQMLGWVRWPITVPTLAQAWTDPATTDSSREATAICAPSGSASAISASTDSASGTRTPRTSSRTSRNGRCVASSRRLTEAGVVRRGGTRR